MEKWWKEHGGNHEDEEWLKWLDVFQGFVATKLQEMGSKHENKIDDIDVFGMAKAGGCTRQSVIKLMGHEGDDNSGSTKFTFALGHIVECMGLATLEVAGYPVQQTQEYVQLAGIMSSAMDGLITLTGKDTPVSVKSSAYKMSGRRFTKGKATFMRRGFTELPFAGVQVANPDHFAQLTAEMAAGDYDQGLMLYVSKDIVKVFEDDDYIGDRGNGSLTFYCELISFQPEVAETIINVHAEQWEAYQQGEAGTPYVMNSNLEYVVLPEPGKVQEDNVWGGPNQVATGRFNPCGGCMYRKVCLEIN